MACWSRNKLVIALVALAGLSGCADYMNNWDTVSLGAGNSTEANTAIQEIEPWPPQAYNTTVGSGG